MRRVFLLVLLLRAGTFTWSQPSDFIATSPGANPDHDTYGAKPWSYVEGPGGPLFPFAPSLTPLDGVQALHVLRRRGRWAHGLDR